MLPCPAHRQLGVGANAGHTSHMNPTAAALLADALLALHVGVVLFVVGLLPLVLIGGALGWRWVHHRGLRFTHLGLIVYIAAQTWLGQLCPLTVWEQDLRSLAGQSGYREGFLEHWFSRLLYWDLPWWVFEAAYTSFAVLVAMAWWWVRPVSGRSAQRPDDQRR